MGKAIRGTLVARTAAGVLLLATGAHAHHSIASVYDGSTRVAITGVVTEYHFVNPHPYAVVSGGPAGEAPQSWRLDLDNRSELESKGFGSAALKPGDHLNVTGSPARDGRRSLYVRELFRIEDGLRLEQTTGTPRVVGPRR